jgi:hypothetical protein
VESATTAAEAGAAMESAAGITATEATGAAYECVATAGITG